MKQYVTNFTNLTINKLDKSSNSYKLDKSSTVISFLRACSTYVLIFCLVCGFVLKKKGKKSKHRKRLENINA